MGNTARYIEAPEIWNGDGASVFLAGGITGCPDWQQEARRMFRKLDATVINPRRADFPIGDPAAAPVQIAWEFDHLRRATAILFWFPASDGPQPIALYELGRYLALGRPLVVGCDPAYPRRQDVIEQVGLAAQDMPVWGNLRATCIAAGAAVASAYRAGQAATPDIDAHATPYGDIPDESGWVGIRRVWFELEHWRTVIVPELIEQRDRLGTDRDRLAAQVAQALSLHRRIPYALEPGHFCGTCQKTWPCATVDALSDAEPHQHECACNRNCGSPCGLGQGVWRLTCGAENVPPNQTYATKGAAEDVMRLHGGACPGAHAVEFVPDAGTGQTEDQHG